MQTHVQRTVSCCFATLRQLRTIRRSVPLYLCFSYWSLHLFSAGWTIATACWSTCRPVSSSVCNPFRTLQPGSSSTWGDPNTSPMHWSAFTGFAFQSGSSSRWPRWHFVLCMVRRRLTWRLCLLPLLTCLIGEDCDLHRLISLMFRPSAYQHCRQSCLSDCWC